MNSYSGQKALLVLFALTRAFALDVDSLPVWNPDVFFQKDSSLDNSKQIQNADSSVRLETHGYKTMQVTVGDGGTQVDQELRLSIQGTVGDSVYIDALLNDVDRPAGNQTTATLQEVDQIYFRAESKYWLLHLGDLHWNDDGIGLYSINRSTLGAMAGVRGGKTEVRGAIGTDEVNRKYKVMNGVSGQKNGYSVSENGDYISVVPESESVWINGVKLRRELDYQFNYAGGLIDFKGKKIPGPDDEIRVEYDSYENENIYNLYAGSGKYRHSNLYLDVSGFRLENDKERLKRGIWTDEDYLLLRKDEGNNLYRKNDTIFSEADSLLLKRPERIDRAGARMRVQADHRYFADIEIALNKEDSNSVSRKINGPEGHAYRWILTTDSTDEMKKFPIALSVKGNFIEKGFDVNKFQGNNQDWNSFKLQDEWDLNDSAIALDDLRYDEFEMRLRLGSGWFTKTSWGYRQGENEEWNSSRSKVSLIHNTDAVLSDIGFAYVSSIQSAEKKRYQFLGNTEFLKGLWRPFGNFDLRYTTVNQNELNDEISFGKIESGFLIVQNNWNMSERIESKIAEHRGDSFDKNWSDSLKSVIWTQTAEYKSRYIDFEHFLQYEHRSIESLESENIWVGDLISNFGDEQIGFYGNLNYKLGLTEEQTYTAIYKSVASGTGDVRYDSLTGTFIEGVDNGDFVYEGLGRNDSVGAQLASNASFGIDLNFNPGFLLKIKNGILRDITLGGMYKAEGDDTTGKYLYFPPVMERNLQEVSSGFVSLEGRLSWKHPIGIFTMYKPGVDYNKKLSSISYFETSKHHEIKVDYEINDSHFVGGNFLFENQEIDALQNLEWKIKDVSARYRFQFLDGFHIEPGGRFRKGNGNDDLNHKFNANLKEGSLRFGYEKENYIDSFIQFSAVQMESGNDLIPYQMMSGYGEGITYRLVVSVSTDINSFIFMGLYYVLRFGNAEENTFQKLNTEARAYF